jgi:hypothetical protein
MFVNSSNFQQKLDSKTKQYIYCDMLKATTVEPEKQPLLVNGYATTFVSTQRLSKKRENSYKRASGLAE